MFPRSYRITSDNDRNHAARSHAPQIPTWGASLDNPIFQIRRLVLDSPRKYPFGAHWRRKTNNHLSKKEKGLGATHSIPPLPVG